jgi:hypothetical protein
MAEPLKNIFSRALLTPLAQDLQSIEARFQAQAYLDDVFGPHFEPLELKQRIRRIAEGFRTHLPAEYPRALAVLSALVEQYIAQKGEHLGFEYLPFPHCRFLPAGALANLLCVHTYCATQSACTPKC